MGGNLTPEAREKGRLAVIQFWKDVREGKRPKPQQKRKPKPEPEAEHPEPEPPHASAASDIYIQSGLLTLIASATMQLDQVGAIPIQQIEAVLASPSECNRVEIVLENLIKRSENLLSIISHCRRNHVIQNNETPETLLNHQPIGLPVGPRRSNYHEPAAV
jgi:hypothetical protein